MPCEAVRLPQAACASDGWHAPIVPDSRRAPKAILTTSRAASRTISPRFLPTHFHEEPNFFGVGWPGATLGRSMELGLEIPFSRWLTAIGLLTESELHEAEARHRATGQRLTDAIVHLGYMSAEEMAGALPSTRAPIPSPGRLSERTPLPEELVAEAVLRAEPEAVDTARPAHASRRPSSTPFEPRYRASSVTNPVGVRGLSCVHRLSSR
jgi:hypothetical protein